MAGAKISGAMSALEWSLLLGLAVLWGATFFFAEIALDEIGPFTLVWGRVGFAAVALLAAVYLSGQRMPSSLEAWRPLFVMGALNNLIPFSLIFWGQTEISSGLAAILNATTPVFAVVLAHVLTADETLTPNRLGGVLLGIAGVAVVIGPEALQGLALHALAQLAVLGAAASYALAGIFGKRFRGQSPLVTAAGQVMATTILMTPLALLFDQPWTQPAPGVTTWAALLGVALLGTALAYVIYFRLLATAGATNLLLVTLLIPVSAILLGTIFLGERLEVQQLGGMALVGLGLAAIDGRPLAYVRGGSRRAVVHSSRAN